MSPAHRMDRLRFLETERELRLIPGATIQLAPGVIGTEVGLQVEATGEVYRATEAGMGILRRIAGGVRVRDLLDLLIGQYCVDPARATDDLCAFIGELDRQQLVSIDQSYLLEAVARLRRMYELTGLVLGLGLPPARARYPRRRYPASPRHILRACLESQQATIAVSLVVPAVFLSLNTVRNIELGAAPLDFNADWPPAALAFYLYALAATSAVHEFGHYLLARWLGIPVWSVFSQFGRSGITLGTNSARRSALLAVVLAGPLAVCLTMALVALCIWVAAPFSGFIRLLLCLLPATIAAIHLYSLLPFSSDGRLIVKISRAGGGHYRVSEVKAEPR
jgi:Coenzyme PQQ synthesis protein D (PqqD)